MPRYEFGSFLLDPEARILSQNGAPTALAGKPLDTLIFLVENRGRVVDKDELLSAVWPGVVVEEASLSQSIFTVRKAMGDSPKDRRYIATVAGRGYQFVAPVAEAVEALEPSVPITRGAPPRPWKITVVVVIALVAVSFGSWLVMRHPSARGELVEHRLTFNSSANDVLSASLSPDGSYLAYSDRFGIHIRLLGTGEERLVAPAGPESYVEGWFPNATELLVHTDDASGHGDVSAVSVAGQSSRHLRSDALGWGVSPDGTRIAFSPRAAGGNASEIWVMSSQGENPERVVRLQENEFTWSVRWSPDGGRLAYIRATPNGQSVETSDLKGTEHTKVVAVSGQSQWVRSLWWMPDRRIVYSRAENADVEANLWQVAVDSQSGRPTSEPKRITRWARTDVLGFSADGDGTRLVLRKVTYPAQIFIGDAVSKPTRAPDRLTNDEAHDGATAWTADGKAVLFESDRSGQWGIYKQRIGESVPEALVEGRESAGLPRLSPDGTWVLYSETSAASGGRGLRHRLMRVSVSGGIPKPVMETTGARWDDYQCARAPASLCVLIGPGEPKLQRVVALDPIAGKGRLLRTIERDAPGMLSLALSPDGSTLAVAAAGEAELHIRLLSLTGGTDRDIRVKGLPNVQSMDWSPDGKGLYCGSSPPSGSTLVFVDLKGTVKALWHSKDVGGGAFIAGLPSPDGRYIALCGAIRNSNAWMIAGF